MVSKQNESTIQILNVGGHARRRGLTLTELLVVIAILVVVTSVLAPLITPSLEGREVREAARQINAYMQQAQAKARELGRPVGVVIQRSEFIGDPTVTPIDTNTPDETLTRQDFGYQLSLAEEPPPFKGFLPTDRAQVSEPYAYLQLSVDPTGRVDPAILKLIQPNDHIRFNLRGRKFRVLHLQASLSEAEKSQFPSASVRVRFEGFEGAGLNKLISPVPFEVFRRPRQTASTPLELPNGTALVMDLSGVGMDSMAAADSGFANSGEETQRTETYSGAANPRQKYIGLTEFKRPSDPDLIASDPTIVNNPLTIMFSPTGSIDRIYRVLPGIGQSSDRRFPPKRPQDKIFLFVGKDAVPTWTNFTDQSNLWIAIDPINGLVTTAPNAVSNDPKEPFNPKGTMEHKLKYIATSRQIAATGQSMGGQ